MDIKIEYNGFGIFSTLFTQAILLAVKLTNYVDWSWKIILIPSIIAGIVFAFKVLFAIIRAIRDERLEELKMRAEFNKERNVFI